MFILSKAAFSFVSVDKALNDSNTDPTRDHLFNDVLPFLSQICKFVSELVLFCAKMVVHVQGCAQGKVVGSP